MTMYLTNITQIECEFLSYSIQVGPYENTIKSGNVIYLIYN
jgi:hypothetical protein